MFQLNCWVIFHLLTLSPLNRDGLDFNITDFYSAVHFVRACILVGLVPDNLKFINSELDEEAENGALPDDKRPAEETRMPHPKVRRIHNRWMLKWHHFKALIIKRFHNFTRNKKGWISETFIESIDPFIHSFTVIIIIALFFQSTANNT